MLSLTNFKQVLIKIGSSEWSSKPSSTAFRDSIWWSDKNRSASSKSYTPSTSSSSVKQTILPVRIIHSISILWKQTKCHSSLAWLFDRLLVTNQALSRRPQDIHGWLNDLYSNESFERSKWEILLVKRNNLIDKTDSESFLWLCIIICSTYPSSTSMHASSRSLRAFHSTNHTVIIVVIFMAVVACMCVTNSVVRLASKSRPSMSKLNGEFRTMKADRENGQVESEE